MDKTHRNENVKRRDVSRCFVVISTSQQSVELFS